MSMFSACVSHALILSVCGWDEHKYLAKPHMDKDLVVARHC